MARYTLSEGEEVLTEVRPSTVKLFLMLLVTLGLYLPWFLLRIVQNRFTKWVLTSRRVIAMRGVLNQETSSLGLERIQEIQHNRTIWDRIIGTGSLVIETASEDKPLHIGFIREDAEFRDALAQAVERRQQELRERTAQGGL
jgi:uncharacterized membrane protein YdbT with pleckstrin-like domain